MHSKHLHFSKKLFEINANWTSLQTLEGWNHYRISSRRQNTERGLELEMMSVVDRKVRVWVLEVELRDPAIWSPGWIDPKIKPSEPSP